MSIKNYLHAAGKILYKIVDIPFKLKTRKEVEQLKNKMKSLDSKVVGIESEKKRVCNIKKRLYVPSSLN